MANGAEQQFFPTGNQAKILQPAFVRDEDERPKVPYDHFGDDRIPVISLRESNGLGRDRIIEQVKAACEEWGIFQVIDHGVSLDVVQQMSKLSREFFGLPPQEKLLYDMRGGKRGGFVVSSHLQGEAVLDWREIFTYFSRPVGARDYSRWPDKPHGWREIVELYSEEMMNLGRKLLEMVSESLGLEREAVTEASLSLDQKIVINFYPKCPEPEMTLGLKRHTDPGTITLLFQDRVGGLQVTKDGRAWVTVDPVEGAFVVNLGDHMHFLSNGRLKSADHRAVVNSKSSRLSIATFQNPGQDAVVYPVVKVEEGEECIMAEPITFSQMYSRKMASDLEAARLRKLTGVASLNAN